MKRNELRGTRIALVIIMMIVLPGCTHIVPEPEDNFTDLPTQSYPFTVVWESTIEAVQMAKFDVVDSEKQGESSGEFITRYVPGERDKVTGIEEAKRLRVRIKETGKDTQQVRVAASNFERQTADDDWSYTGTDSELIETIKKNLHESLDQRYKTRGR